MKKINKISLGALMSALAVAVLALGIVFPTLDLSLSILAGLIILIAEIELGDKLAWGVYFVVSVISLLLPQKSPAILFAVFAGWYPILKKHIEKVKYPLSWIVKFSAFNTAFLIFWFFSSIITQTQDKTVIFWITFALANVCFVLFDLLLGRMVLIYIFKLRKRLGFKGPLK